MQKTKSVSRSSSGVGTSSRQSSKIKDGSDETSSRCFSPSLRNDYIEEESDSDEQQGTDFRNKKSGNGRKITPLPENEYSTLRSVKKTLSKSKSGSKFGLFTNQTKKKEKNLDRYELAQKTPILDKYDQNTVQENNDEDFGPFSEDDGSYSFSDFEEHEDPNEQYSKIDKGRDQRRSPHKMKERARSNLGLNEDNYKTKTRTLTLKTMKRTEKVRGKKGNTPTS